MIFFIGFIIGFIIPLFSLRFPKFMPADAGTSLSYMFHIPHFHGFNKRLMKKWAKLISNCCLCGIINIGLLYYLNYKLEGTYSIFAISIFLFILGLLGHIDYRTMYLPDVLTVPLLIFGFYFAPDYHESAIGALYGYFMPTLASAVVCRFKSDAFGGGDVKILAALGAWLGLMGVSVAIVLSVVLFIFASLIKRKNAGPYGPAIGVAAYLVFANIAALPFVISLITF